MISTASVIAMCKMNCEYSIYGMSNAIDCIFTFVATTCTLLVALGFLSVNTNGGLEGVGGFISYG